MLVEEHISQPIEHKTSTYEFGDGKYLANFLSKPDQKAVKTAFTVSLEKTSFQTLIQMMKFQARYPYRRRTDLTMLQDSPWDTGIG